MNSSDKNFNTAGPNRRIRLKSNVWQFVVLSFCLTGLLFAGANFSSDVYAKPEPIGKRAVSVTPNSNGFSFADSTNLPGSTAFLFEVYPPSSTLVFPEQNRYRVNGSVYDKSDKLVQPITVTVINTKTGYRQTTTEKGKFRLMLPPGRYNFTIRDSGGRFNNYNGLDINSNTSINFMFAGRTVAPAPAPSVSFNSTSKSIERGGSATLSWAVTGASKVSIDQGIGNVASTGSRSVSPVTTTRYVLSAANNGGTTDKSVVIEVSESADLPSATFKSTPQTITRGQSTTLAWTTDGATDVTIDNGIGKVPLSGSVTVSPRSSTSYLLTISNDAGIIFRTARVRVRDPRIPVGPNTPDENGGGGTVDPVEDDEDNTNTDFENTNTNSFNANTNSIGNVNSETDKESQSAGDSRLTRNVLYTLLGVGLIVGLGLAVWGLLPVLIPLVGAGLGALGLAGQTATDDEVHCTLYSQPEVSAGSDLLVQIFAHLLEQSDELDELAQMLDPDARKQMSKALKKRIKRDSVLTFKLMVPGIELDEEEQDIVWRGEPDSVEFIIPIPPEHAAGKRFGRVYVYSNGEEIGKIPFRINILPLALQLDTKDTVPRVGGVMTDNDTAFVSYASRDKEKVYRFVQLMDVLKYKFHIDIFHIDAGDRWEQKLYEFIDKDDVFLLFWSEAASQSEWVVKEAKLAKERMANNPKSLPRIIIYNLDNKVAVPEWLQDIHVDRKWAEIIGTIESQTKI